ncbi:MAG: hypothetical protein AAB368_06810 [bacterium]
MKAIALLSGGLDSCLAVQVIQAQGVEVEAFNFQTALCATGSKGASCGDATRIAAAQGFNLRVIHIGQEYLDMVSRPKHGWGKNMNPCIDCRILMLRKARQHLDDVKASFIITGEVLGQRPMSQHWRAMKTVEHESGLEGLLLRPLSARLLPPTIPEIKGWVDRDRLPAIEGRQRKEQFAMAKAFGLVDPPTPASGCLLTDPAYSDRLRDVLRHSSTGRLTVHLAQVIKYGRFFRFTPVAFVVVGRNEDDNFNLEGLQTESEWSFKPVNCVGPVALGVGELDGELRRKTASILARYADRPADGQVLVAARQGPEGRDEMILTGALEPERAGAARI